MNEGFENWLKKDPELLEFYNDNPKSQEDIFRDYQMGILFDDFDNWVEWAFENEAFARKNFPDAFKYVEDTIRESPPIMGAFLVKSVADNFEQNKKRIEALSGPRKRYEIEKQIELHDVILSTVESKPAEIRETIINRQDELEYSLGFWKAELNNLDANSAQDFNPNSELEKTINSFFEADSNKGWSYFFYVEEDYRYLRQQLVNHFENSKAKNGTRTIRTRQRTKAKLAATLGRLHREISSENSLKPDVDYFRALRCIDVFAEERDLYKTLTRNR